MTPSKKITTLWQVFRTIIDRAYVEREKQYNPEAESLRDYVKDMAQVDALEELLDREATNEREHRHGWPSDNRKFSARTAAKLIIMHNAVTGSRFPAAIPASHFLIYRQSAVEAEVIGYLCRFSLDCGWVSELDALDYVALKGNPVTGGAE